MFTSKVTIDLIITSFSIFFYWFGTFLLLLLGKLWLLVLKAQINSMLYVVVFSAITGPGLWFPAYFLFGIILSTQRSLTKYTGCFRSLYDICQCIHRGMGINKFVGLWIFLATIFRLVLFFFRLHFILFELDISLIFSGTTSGIDHYSVVIMWRPAASNCWVTVNTAIVHRVVLHALAPSYPLFISPPLLNLPRLSLFVLPLLLNFLFSYSSSLI
jgi:hypothetical protein